MKNKLLLLIGLIVLLLVLAGGSYFFYQASLNQQAVSVQSSPTLPTPPLPTNEAPQNQIKLVITSPLPNSSVSTSQIAITGQTIPLADVVVNDTEVKANTLGNFSVIVNLEEGENPILIVASDENGNYSEQEITVTYVK